MTWRLYVPEEINYALTRGKNGTKPWMVNRCAPNPVSFVDGCDVWCEMPRHMTGPAWRPQGKFVECLEANGWRGMNRWGSMLLS